MPFLYKKVSKYASCRVLQQANKVNKKGEFTYINKTAINKLSSYTTDVTSLNDKEHYKFLKYNDTNGNELAYEDTPTQRVLRGEIITDEVIMGTDYSPGINHLATIYHKCNGTPIYDEYGNVDGGVLIYKDIENIYKVSEYHAFRKDIEALFLRYASLSYDDFKIKYMNEAAMDMVKRFNPHIKLETEVIGKDFFDYYYLVDGNQDDLIKEVKKSIEEKRSYSFKQKFIEGGKVKYIKTIFYPIYDENHEVEKVDVIDIDITDEEMANEEMNSVLKMQDEMFINTSHELKTPLNLIFSASQLLSMYLKKDSSINIKENIVYSNDIIIQNCYRLTRLINNILDISKIESGFYELNLRNNDIVYVIGNIVHSVAEYIEVSGLEIKFESKVEKLITAFDIYKIERILLNLISNAIKFSNTGEVILVILEYKDGYIQISVQDTGIGIEEKDQGFIFEKYRQVNVSLNRISEGTGIGLPLAKSIIELHGGKIDVESTLGKGSIFTIKLPMMTVENENIEPIPDYDKNKIEMIKFELSDIYS